jgi:nitroreductase
MDAPGFNDRSSTIALLQSRRSGKARDMVAPGPTETELETILSVASRVPDHGKLAPWAFVVIEDRSALSSLLRRLYRAEKPEAGRLELEAMDSFARQAPTLVALLSTPRECHIPLWEQQLSAGAVAQNLLLAAHACGYVGNWLTGAPAYLKGVTEALGHPDATVVGWFFLGTPAKGLEERPRPTLSAITSHWRG